MSWQNIAGPRHIYSSVIKNGNGRLELFVLADDGDIHHCWQLEAGYSDLWSQWRSLGGEWLREAESMPRTFAVGVDSGGCLEIFVVAAGAAPYGKGQIFHNEQTHPDEGEGSWTGWHGLKARDAEGWSKEVGPTVVRNKDGFLELFVMSADRGKLEEYWWSDYTSSTPVGHYRQTEDDLWSGPESRVSIETCIEVEGRTDYLCVSKLPVKLVSAINRDGRPELFASVGNLQARRPGLPGLTYIPPTLWNAHEGRNHTKHWWTSTLSMPPTDTGQPDAGNSEYDSAAAQPCAVQGHDGNLELFMWDSARGAIWARKQDFSIEGGWAPWQSLGGSQKWGHPTVASDGDNLISVFAPAQSSGAVWYLAQHVDESGEVMWAHEWQPVDSESTPDEPGIDLLHAVTNYDGRIELFASGPDGMGFSHTFQQVPGKWLKATEAEGVVSMSR